MRPTPDRILQVLQLAYVLGADSARREEKRHEFDRELRARVTQNRVRDVVCVKAGRLWLGRR